MHAAQQAARGLTLSARQTVDVPPVALPSTRDEQMGEPLIVHQVAVQCGALCWGFCARICVFMVARRPRGGPTSSISSSSSRSSRRRRQGRELLSPVVAGLHPSPLYACVRTRNPLVSLTPSHRRQKKSCGSSGSSSSGINSALFNLARVLRRRQAT